MAGNENANKRLAALKARMDASLKAYKARMPGVKYLDYIMGIGEPDLASTILVEIPAYCDPEVVKTVKAALANAANPDRIRFVVCLQDDDGERLEALRAMAAVRLKHYAVKDAPGACAARYECNLMYDGEDFVFHTDAHMRFAKFWDVAMIEQWRSCGDEKAVLSGYAKNFGSDKLGLPVGSMDFTEMALVGGRLLTAGFFSRSEPEASLRVSGVDFDGPSPKLGAFIAAGLLFCRGAVDAQVPVDPNMRFFGDEMGMSPRYWTHGCDIYQPGVRCVFHLYADERRKAGYQDEVALRRSLKASLTEDGITREEREFRRMEKLLGVYDRPDTDLGGFGLGTERTLAEYEDFCGVDFRRMRIRKFATDGTFGGRHDQPGEMDFVDWRGGYGKWLGEAVHDRPLCVGVRKTVADRFEGFCAERCWDPSSALSEAVRDWMAREEGLTPVCRVVPDAGQLGRLPSAARAGEMAAGDPARVVRTGISWGKQAVSVPGGKNGGAKDMQDKCVKSAVGGQWFKAGLRVDMDRMGSVKYLEYLDAIDEPDLASTILIEIPAYCDPELMKTIESARAMAANPDRLHFAVCYQGDDEEELAALRGIPNCKVVRFTKAGAPGLCAARNECQKLLDGEDWVLHLDSHMRFAKYWDVALVAQWHACGDGRAIISEYCRDYSQWADESVDSDLFTRDVWTSGRFINVNHFHYKTCKVSFTARHTFDGPLPRKAAFIGGHLVFGRPELDVEVPSDPDMYFTADEVTVAARYWTHGFNIYQPGVRCVYHLYGRVAAARKAGRELSRNVGDAALTGKEFMRMEAILGVKDHGIDFGPFGLGTARSLQDYEAFAGVRFRDMSIRKFAYDGAYDVMHGPEELEPFDWIGFSRERGLDLGRESALECMVPEQVLEAFRRRCLERVVLPEIAVQRALEDWTGDASDRFRSRLRADMARMAGSEYLSYISGIADPDLSSTILVEIPSYDDPEVVNTVRAALAQAANPDRVRFAVCLQDDDPSRLEALRAVPDCRVRHYALKDAPGACAARADCQAMYAGEDFVFHMDAHMRFARYWDVVAIDQWRLCGNGKAILGSYPKGIREPWLELPVDDDLFTEQAEMRGCRMAAFFFSGNRCELRCRPGSIFKSDVPVKGGFMSAGCSFRRGGVDVQVPVDPNMDFTGDESAMAARYWTHGYDFYHPAVRCVFHLYEREKIYTDKHIRPASSPVGDDGLTRAERQARRLEKLLGTYDRPDVDLAGYGLGTERSLEEYQAFAGVDFRRLTVRKFAAYGMCGGGHTADDMEFFDWKAEYRKVYGRDVPDPGERLELNIPPEAKRAFESLCAEMHWHPQAALAEAVRQWIDAQRRP